MSRVFDDFPGYSDWFVGEKALSWRKRHEAEIIEDLNKLNSVREVVPDLIQALQLLDDLAPQIPEYKARRRELIDVLKTLLEGKETG